MKCCHRVNEVVFGKGSMAASSSAWPQYERDRAVHCQTMIRNIEKYIINWDYFTSLLNSWDVHHIAPFKRQVKVETQTNRLSADFQDL